MESIDLTAALAAAQQLGVVTRPQLRAMGMTPTQVDHRLRQGHLVPIHQGVFRLASSPPGHEQTLLAACLATGPGAAVSHRAAAALWGLRGIERPRPEIIAPARHRAVPGVILHTMSLDDIDRTRLGILPITAPARTLFDVVAVVSPLKAEAAFDDLLLRGLVSHSLLRQTHDRLRGPGRRGAKVFGKLLAARNPSTMPTQTDLELAILRVIRAAGLPEPVRQHPVREGSREVFLDLAYPHLMLGIEGDSVRWHSGRADLERNASKRNFLLHMGWRLLSFTWWDATTRGDALVATVRRELNRAGA